MRPKSFPSIEEKPDRMRALFENSLMFEKVCAPPLASGATPLLMIVVLWIFVIFTTFTRPPKRPYHGWYQSHGPIGSQPTLPKPDPNPNPKPKPPPPNPKNET